METAAESREAARVEAEGQKAQLEDANKNIEELTDKLASSDKALSKLQAKYDELVKEHEEVQTTEKGLREKLAEVQADVSEKVDAGHSSVKKMVDIQKTNEDISQQLIEKSREATEFLKKATDLERELVEVSAAKESQEAELQAQKLAYEGVLDSMQKL